MSYDFRITLIKTENNNNLLPEVKQKEQAFLANIRKHKGVLYKVSKMYMDTTEDREDLFQEIVLQLWKSYDNFKGNSEFSTWMYRVALNTAIVYLKKEKKNSSTVTYETTMDIAVEEYSHEKENQLKYFYKAVQELNSIEKALIFLFLEGQSHKDIGKNLGLSEVNARVKLNRTKEKLQKIIQANGYEF